MEQTNRSPVEAPVFEVAENWGRFVLAGDPGPGPKNRGPAGGGRAADDAARN